MPYDEALADRVRPLVEPLDGCSEQQMFGGLSFMLHGNVCCGIIKDELIVRTSPERAAALLDEPHVRPMDFTGRPMRGWLFVGSEACADDDLERWVRIGVEFASALPRK